MTPSPSPAPEREGKHTPTPWEIRRNVDGIAFKVLDAVDADADDRGRTVLYQEEVCDISDTMQADANAELIVRAVNSHAEMLDVLNSARYHVEQGTGIYNAIMAAIAKAEGGTA